MTAGFLALIDLAAEPETQQLPLYESFVKARPVILERPGSVSAVCSVDDLTSGILFQYNVATESQTRTRTSGFRQYCTVNQGGCHSVFMLLPFVCLYKGYPPPQGHMGSPI